MKRETKIFNSKECINPTLGWQFSMARIHNDGHFVSLIKSQINPVDEIFFIVDFIRP